MSDPINSAENENENKDNDIVIHPIESIDLDNQTNKNDNQTNKNDNQTNKNDNEDSKSNEFLLKLGDVILIIDPTNEILNKNTFLIEYIDPNKIKVINTETLDKTLIPISSDGFIGDGNIESIKIISSASENGYARQNGLLPGIWLNIYFGGQFPAVITGKITNIEEDMIEIKTIDNDTFYINFNYQGIPEELPIESFEIRPEIKGQEEPEIKGQEEPEQIEMADELDELKEEEDNIEIIPKQAVKEKIQRMMVDMSDLELGEIIKVEEYVNISRDKYRYNIEAQTNDLLEEMISTIPSANRTSNVLNGIHIMINRFIQLRKISSTFDANDNVTGKIIKTSNDKPLAEYLSGFKNTLYWIMMVAKGIKKIYPGDSKTGRFDDYETLNENESLVRLSNIYKNSKYIDTGRKSSSTVKYNRFTYQSFDEYMTPFYSLNPESINDAFTKPNGVIIEGNVETDINAIIDNLDDFYSTIVANSKITNRRFIIQKYNLGLDKLYATNLKGQRMIAHRVKLTENDPISINGMLTLPEPTVRFSQVNLPGSNLLVKANLNLHFLNYWQLLKQKTNVTNVEIDGLDNELDYDDANFVDNIKHYYLNLTDFEKPTDLTNLDIYKIFLRTIIPKIRILFGLVKKYIKGRLSMVDVINYLEPFLIYPIDLTYMQYKDINNFIFKKIKEYNNIFEESKKAFIKIKDLQAYNEKLDKTTERYIHSNPLFKLIGDNRGNKYGCANDVGIEDLELRVFQDYGIQDKKLISESGSEFLKRVTASDYGNLYNTAVALTNIELMFPSNLSSIINGDKDAIKVEMDKIQMDKNKLEPTKRYIVAKKYYSTDALNEDNNKVIYYDKQFDTTNYNLIDEKYKKEKEGLSDEEFTFFLVEKLKTDQKLDERDAEYMADALINRTKKVREGDYAILVREYSGDTQPSLEYYVRNNDIWVLDDKTDSNNFMEQNSGLCNVKQDDVLCNMDFSCVYNTKGQGQCETSEVAKDTIINKAIKDILAQFDKNYNLSKEELNTHICSQLKYFFDVYDRIQKINRTQFFRYNNQQYNLGLSVAEEIKDVVSSPYTKLRDLIMGQNDVIKKNGDILNFVRLYCREGNPDIPNIHDNEMEDEWWLYCVKTDRKLLPKFVHILAETYIKNNNNYDVVLEDLKRKIGKISADGDAWVDEHSGEIICYIDFDISEGYKDGFVNKSRDILEKDIGETILENQQKKKTEVPKRLSDEGQLISNVVTILSANMGIDIEDSRDFIIKIVSELMNDVNVLVKESAYKKKVEDAEKKGKQIRSYASLYSSTLMFLTLGMYLIAVQTSIPSIKTRKTAPGCVRSFSGFPFEGEGDDSGIIYLACVALKSRDSSIMPWNSLPKKEQQIVETTKGFITKYLLEYSQVRQKIKDKTEYLLLNNTEEIPEEYNLGRWTSFLPPLRKFSIIKLDSITDGFEQELHNELKNGNYRQDEKLLVIESKIISYSLAIQECIQKIVDKKNLLLKASNKYFTDNACCNEPGNKTMTSLQYFINEDNNINNYNNTVIKLTSLMRDVHILTSSAIMLSNIDTKNHFPMLSNEISEENIYRAFITLCKFQSAVPLTEEIKSICIDKPDYLNRVDTIEEKIEKLKRDERNYTKEQFLRLFQVVSRNNIIKISLDSSFNPCLDEFNKVLKNIDEQNNEYVPKSLMQYFEKLGQSYEVNLEEDRSKITDLRNYLDGSNKKIRKELKEFITVRGGLPKTELTNINKFIDNLSNWDFDVNVRNADIKISDDGLYNYINYFKNMIELVSTVFPSMIVNQQMQTIKVPSYWNLHRSHANDVVDMISKFYSPIQKFYGNSRIKNVLNKILERCKEFYMLSCITPVLTNIKLGDQEQNVYSMFDKRTTTLLYEYYLLSILIDYKNIVDNSSIVKKLLVVPENEESSAYKSDFIMEKEMELDETEQNFIQGSAMTLKKEVASLLVAFINIMLKSKQTINTSYDDIQTKLFRSKEAEKYNVTDRFKEMNDETREVDNILKKNKLGEIWSRGLKKGLKEYVKDDFEAAKYEAEQIAKTAKKIRKNRGRNATDAEINDGIIDAFNADDIADDVALETMEDQEDMFNDVDGDAYGDY
jgi:hypothetical protein